MDAARPRRWWPPRFRLRTLLGFVVVAALGVRFWLLPELLVEPYRREWRAEQAAIARMRAAGAHVGAAYTVVGPRWLRTLAGRGRVRYFERVNGLYFVASNSPLANRKVFKHLNFTFQD